MEVKQFFYGRDNFSYVFFSSGEAAVVDGGAVKDILAFCEKEFLRIKYILNTHGHWDHLPGNEQLQKATGISLLSLVDLKKKSQLQLGKETIEIIQTPGHTLDSVCYYAAPILLTGDTLFNGTVGNCDADRLKVFGESLLKLMTYPPETKIYAGHDYYMDSVEVIQKVDPQNPNLEAYRKNYNENEVVSTLEMELEVNPYLRFDTLYYRQILAERNLPNTTQLDRFQSVYQYIG